MQFIVRAAEIDSNPDYNIANFYETLVSCSISQNPILTGAPQIKEDATAIQARTKSQQLKGAKGAGKKGKGGKDSSSSSQPAKESAESNSNTKALVEKKAKETGESAADMRKKIKQLIARRKRSPESLRKVISLRTRARRSARFLSQRSQ